MFWYRSNTFPCATREQRKVTDETSPSYGLQMDMESAWKMVENAKEIGKILCSSVEKIL